MSYDISIGDFDRNYTWNMGYVLHDAGIDVYSKDCIDRFCLHGSTGEEAAPWIRKAIALALENWPAYKAKEPKNGWGSLATFLPWLIELHAACVENPTDTIHCC